ncbi:hypothetical protein C8Q74DRAFT_703909 [Fomes fomentarius]|nr:hypothetical protein C8Q74DRAFT_703909 [Fomes fomentarius]
MDVRLAAACALASSITVMHGSPFGSQREVTPASQTCVRTKVATTLVPVLRHVQVGLGYTETCLHSVMDTRSAYGGLRSISRQPTAVTTNPMDNVKTVSLLQRCRNYSRKHMRVPAAANSNHTDWQLCLEASILLDPNARVLGFCCSRKLHDTHTRCHRWTCSHYLHADIGTLVMDHIVTLHP